jgi:hypothetical protein
MQPNIVVDSYNVQLSLLLHWFHSYNIHVALGIGNMNQLLSFNFVTPEDKPTKMVAKQFS